VDWTTVILWSMVWALVAAAAAFALFMTWAVYTYGSHIDKVLRTKPLLIAETQPHREGGETIEFPSANGRRLSASYFHHAAAKRRGVIAFCHEFGGDRWLFESYLGPLLAEGFDVFAFDFCNHGKSDSIPGYEPTQWVTRYEVEDVMAAVDYLSSLRDADEQGLVLVGVSKGGGAALAAAAERPQVWGLVIDGAYPNHGMVIEYMKKWVGIFSTNRAIYTRLPNWFFKLMCEWGLFWMARRQRVQFVRLERSIRALGPRPVFMIRGARDNYVTPTIIKGWFARGDAVNKEFWDVPGAKHNLCVNVAESEYHKRVVEFLRKHSPVPPLDAKFDWQPAEKRAPVADRGMPQPSQTA
jgi:uncharacterized protein